LAAFRLLLRRQTELLRYPRSTLLLPFQLPPFPELPLSRDLQECRPTLLSCHPTPSTRSNAASHPVRVFTHTVAAAYARARFSLAPFLVAPLFIRPWKGTQSASCVNRSAWWTTRQRPSCSRLPKPAAAEKALQVSWCAPAARQPRSARVAPLRSRSDASSPMTAARVPGDLQDGPQMTGSRLVEPGAALKPLWIKALWARGPVRGPLTRRSNER